MIEYIYSSSKLKYTFEELVLYLGITILGYFRIPFHFISEGNIILFYVFQFSVSLICGVGLNSLNNNNTLERKTSLVRIPPVSLPSHKRYDISKIETVGGDDGRH